jgi:hypothetical protein
MRSPCHPSQARRGSSAKAERKKTTSPTGYRALSVFKVADMSVNARADRTLREIPRRGFKTSSRFEQEMQPITMRSLREGLLGGKALRQTHAA